MPANRLARFALLPKLDLLQMSKNGRKSIVFTVKKTSPFEVCPGCAHKTAVIYDHRYVKIKDAPVRGKIIELKIKKRRFLCKNCGKVFMEPVSGISKGRRFTQRFKQHVLWSCEQFSDLKSVKKSFGCSYGFIYTALYEQLALNRKKHVDPWPRVTGIDEHSFKKNKKYGYTEFVTFFIDHKNRKAIELVEGKSKADLRRQTSYLKGKERVSWVTMDLCAPFRSFVRDEFPNAQIVADKFHVVRLLDIPINRHRKEITGDKRKNPIRKLLLKNSHKLDHWKQSAINKWLAHHPALREIYFFKQAIHRLYRTKGYNKARNALKKILDRMDFSAIPEVQRVRGTLLKWRNEILNYFKTGLTNARVEGFNNKAKLIKRKAYGYKSFKNYRLRVLNACC